MNEIDWKRRYGSASGDTKVIICSEPGCQTSAGCMCSQRLGRIVLQPHGCICLPVAKRPVRAGIVRDAL
jgi:hypothetical protein